MLNRFRNRVWKYLPRPVLDVFGLFRFFLRRVSSFGFRYYCPVCNSRIREWRVVRYHNLTNTNLQCPVCSSMERHRLDWLFLVKCTNLLNSSPQRLFHVAPEPFFISNFTKVSGIQYVTGDLSHRLAMVWLDLTAIPISTRYFDAIYCSHVLEHIQDDKKALSELFRILKCGGWAVLQVPITVEKTLEDPSIVEPMERERVFGQRDHVRRCGWDYVDRMHSVGFVAQILPAEEIITAQESLYMGIQMTRVVVWCKKAHES